MNQNEGLVSIIVPMRNAENYVSDALVSILREKQVPIEVIVVNDNSTDSSLDRVLNFSEDRVRVIEGRARGVAATLNTGLAEARGAIIMRCDGDDLYPEKRIMHQVAWLRANPEYAAVCGSYSTIDCKGRLVSELPCGGEPVEITGELIRGIIRTSLCTYAIRAEAMVKVGKFRDYFETSSDIDMQLRLCEVGRIGYVPEIFYYWRIHTSSLTHQQSNALVEFFEQTALELQKQRRKSGSDDLQRGHPPLKPAHGSHSLMRADVHIQSMLLGRAWRQYAQGRKLEALRTGIRALIVEPRNLRLWKSVLALVVKSIGANRNR